MDDLRSARRELRAAARRAAGVEVRTLGTIGPMTNGAELRVQWYRERLRRPVVSLQVYYPDGAGGWRADWDRFIRVHLDELPQLARAIARACDEAERYTRRPEGSCPS